MNNSIRLTQRIEIAFWATLITMMENSPQVRSFLPELYRRIQMLRRISFLTQLFSLAFLGLLLGFLIGFAG